jgi:hypothetical protein
MTEFAGLESVHAIEQSLLAFTQLKTTQSLVERSHSARRISAQFCHARSAFPIATCCVASGSIFSETLINLGREQEIALRSAQFRQQNLGFDARKRVTDQRFGLAACGFKHSRTAHRSSDRKATQRILRGERSLALPDSDRTLPVLGFTCFFPGQLQGRLIEPSRETRRRTDWRCDAARNEQREGQGGGTPEGRIHTRTYPSRCPLPRCMKKPLTIFLAVLFVALVGGVVALMMYLKSGILSDPAEIRALAQEIVPIEVPAELRARQGVQFFGGKLAIFEGSDVRNSLVLASFPAQAVERSEADWEVQTQINWEQFDANPKIEHSELAMIFRGMETIVSVSEITLENGGYRGFLLQTEVEEERMLKIFRVGPIGDVDAAHFQALLDQAGPL